MVIYLFPLLLFSLWAKAHIIQDTISHLEPSFDSKSSTLVLVSSGKVLKLNAEKRKDLNPLLKAMNDKKRITFDINADRTINSWETHPHSEKVKNQTAKGHFSFEPTILESLESVKKIFKDLRPNSTSWSQCFNRAHIWAYESHQKYQLYSMKVFLFFSSKYIRRYDYEWWFHVSPYTLDNKEKITERVLDLNFAKSPLLMKAWTDIFMINKASCAVVERYSQYRQGQDKVDCHLIKTSMYYLQPLDLDKWERNGTEKINWNSYEIRRAYRNGFNVW